MLLIVFATLLATAVLTKDYKAAVSMEIVSDIAQLQHDWEPLNPVANPFYGLSADDLKAKLGLQRRSASIFTGDVPVYKARGLIKLPESFDARKQWPGCVAPVNK
jgi:hypothetical protein